MSKTTAAAEMLHQLETPNIVNTVVFTIPSHVGGAFLSVRRGPIQSWSTVASDVNRAQRGRPQPLRPVPVGGMSQ